MPFSVHLSTKELARLSATAIAKLKIQLHGVAELAERCAEDDPIWTQLRDSDSGQLQFLIEGLSVAYLVDRARRTVSVAKVVAVEQGADRKARLPVDAQALVAEERLRRG